MNPAPEPPVDRPTKMRWGCVVALSIGFILLLAVVVQPHHGSGLDANFVTSTLEAGGIHKGLRMYAADHEGRFPEGLTNSNEAYRKLIPDYIQEEKPFAVHGSAWHAAAPGRKPDYDIGLPPAYKQALQRGENHWAYVSGLRDTSDGHLPLIADGFVEGAPGTYTDNPSKKGGVWKGTKAIVILVSGAAQPAVPSRKSGFRVLRPDPATGAEIDLFQLPAPSSGTAAARVLNPE